MSLMTQRDEIKRVDGKFDCGTLESRRYLCASSLSKITEASLTDNSIYLDLIFNLSTVGYWST